MTTRRLLGSALRLTAAAVFLAILAAVLRPELRNVTGLGVAVLLAIAPPWLALSWLVLRRHPLAPWLAIGSLSAAFPIGIGARALTTDLGWYAEALYDLGALVLAVAAVAVVVAERIDGARVHWRWRLTGVGLGAMLPWLPSFLFLAAAGLIWDVHPWWNAPQALVAILPLMVGGVAVGRGRTWGLAALSMGVVGLLLVDVPAPEQACTGPQGHPFGYGFARWVMACAAALAIAPWLAPAARALFSRARCATDRA